MTAPYPITKRRDTLWLHDSAASRAIERAALARHPAHALMQRAGHAVVQCLMAIAPHAGRTWIAAGPGNNGGDGLVAATLLHRLGREVEVTWLGDPARLSDDAAWALALARSAGVSIRPDWPDQPPDAVIDALLGLGGLRPPEGTLLEAIVRINAASGPRLAIDLPSGLCGDTGRVLGRAAVQASATLSVLTLKPGLLTGLGRDHAGELWLSDLGITPDATGSTATARLISEDIARQVLRPRQHGQHKGSFGDVWVIGGAPGMVGAATLASRAALAAGAGRVLLNQLAQPDAGAPDPLRPEVMQRTRAGWQAANVLERATVVCGCGGGEAVATDLPALLSRSGRLVLDADALNAMAADASLADALSRRGRRGQPTVITPHPLEAARLAGSTTAQVQADRIGAAQALSKRFGAVVVLKSSGTIVASPDSLPAINPTGNARLATAGSGDVLAGWLGGLWSRHGMDTSSSPPLALAREAAQAAVWLHGRAAELDAAPASGGHALSLSASDLLLALTKAATAPAS